MTDILINQHDIAPVTSIDTPTKLAYQAYAASLQRDLAEVDSAIASYIGYRDYMHLQVEIMEQMLAALPPSS